MTLEQLLKLENITNYYILWYGADCVKDYFDKSGFYKKTVELTKCKPSSEDTIYIFLSGINRQTCKYRCATKLIPTEADSVYSFEQIKIGLDDYAGRLILRRETGFTYYNTAATAKDFVVDEIWGKEVHRTVSPFTDYDSVELSFDELQEVIEGHYPDYYKALSSVKGIYMIIDGNTGKQYVGSAYGEEGIWGRWNSYANTFHGDNLELKRLFDEKGGEYFRKFKYIIVQSICTSHCWNVFKNQFEAKYRVTLYHKRAQTDKYYHKHWSMK